MISNLCLAFFLLGFFVFFIIYCIKYGDWRDYDPELYDPDTDPCPPPESDHE